MEWNWLLILFGNLQRFSPAPWPGTGYLSKPFGYSNFPKEIIPWPKSWVEKDGNLVFYREHEKVCFPPLSPFLFCVYWVFGADLTDGA